MNLEMIREYCLSFPHATEDVQWGNDLLFRIAGKIFAVVNLELAESGFISFKCSPEVFAELIERPGVAPAAYVGRYHWVSVERSGAVEWKEMKKLIRDLYQMVRDKLPKSVRATLETKPEKSKPGKRTT